MLNVVRVLTSVLWLAFSALGLVVSDRCRMGSPLPLLFGDREFTRTKLDEICKICSELKSALLVSCAELF